ncbi:hypothetical protein HanPI659440_Chr08g0292651 [Helianthus annuus]|nr:hypothetical protein HanPI659440_Chr08g0292651 [Helianthus annuus]
MVFIIGEKNKKISASVLVGATTIWVLFELLEYHLVTLLFHISILVFALLFLWSSASKIINKIPEDIVLQFASALRIEINNFLQMLRGIASGRDLKKFLAVIAGLWVLSIVGSWCNLLTLFYMSKIFRFLDCVTVNQHLHHHLLPQSLSTNTYHHSSSQHDPLPRSRSPTTRHYPPHNLTPHTFKTSTQFTFCS